MSNRQPWRLIADEIRDPAMHFAMEEALLRLTDENYTQPTLRLRRVEPSVWIGYYQSPAEDVDIDYCTKHNLKIIRRLNAGGAVYQDNGTFCYSAFFNKSQFFSSFNITRSEQLYPLFGKVIIDLCKELNINANISPVNDITVNNRKIYGSAQLEWYTAFVHSGSILVNVNREAMQATLRPSNLKFADKGFTNVKDRVINLAELTETPTNVEQVMMLFVKNFEKNMKAKLVKGTFTDKEWNLAKQLFDEKYSRPEWTFSNSNAPKSMVSVKIPSGVLILKYELLNNRFKSVALLGDFLLPNHSEAESFMLICRDKTPSQAILEVEKTKLPADLKKGIVTLLNQIVSDGTH